MAEILKRTNIELGDTGFLDMRPLVGGGVELVIREGKQPRASMYLSREQTHYTIKALCNGRDNLRRGEEGMSGRKAGDATGQKRAGGWVTVNICVKPSMYEAIKKLAVEADSSFSNEARRLLKVALARKHYDRGTP